MTVPGFDQNESFTVSPYNPQWPVLFEQERVIIMAALGDEAIQIEHIGSTSVPNLEAKPIIDIMVVVDRFGPLDTYCQRLEPIFYLHHSHDADADRLFFWKGIPRTHHMHIVQFGTWEHQRHLLFRDYLRSHPEIAQLYAEVKEQLADAFKHNRPAYTKGKTAFIKSIMTRAVEEIEDPELHEAMRELMDGLRPNLGELAHRVRSAHR